MRYLLAFFFFLMYMGDNLGLNISFGLGLSVKNLLLYAIFSGIALNTAVTRNRRVELPCVWIPFGLLILYAVITWVAVAFVLNRPDYQVVGSFIRLKSSLLDQFLTFLIFFYGVVNTKDAYWLLRALVWIVITGNIVTFVDSYDMPNLGLVEARLRDGRFEGFVGQANEFGMFLVLFLPASVALYVSESGKLRSLAAIGVIVTATVLVLTGSRGAYMGIIASAILGAFFLRRQISTQLVVRASFITICICALVFSATFITGYSDIYLESLAKFEGGTHIATSGRSTIWSNLIQAMIESPLSFMTGFGFNAYESSRSFYTAPHNTYLNYLYNLGTIGLTIFIAIFAQTLLVARSVVSITQFEYRPYFVALIFGLFGFMITIIFGEYHLTGYLLWAYLGVTMRVAMEARPNQDLFNHKLGPG